MIRRTIPADEPPCPPWLGEVARDVWAETVRDLTQVPGLLCRVDAAALATFCEAVETYRAANAVVLSEGLFATARNGVVYQHPAVGIRNKAREQILRIGSKFGLNPLDRARCAIDTDPDKADPAAEFIA